MEMVEHTVAVVQSEAIPYDSFIRLAIKEKGFTICEQQVVTLTAERAKTFVSTYLPDVDAAKASKHLSSGPVMILLLQKEDAVAAWTSLMGSINDIAADSEAAAKPAAEDNTSLRCRFGKDKIRCGLRGSPSLADASKWTAFFFSHNSNRDTSLKMNAAQREGMTIEELFQFCFPDGIKHPQTTGRLFCFAKYGPFVRDYGARGEVMQMFAGEKFSHRLTFGEIAVMCTQIEHTIQSETQTPERDFKNYTKQDIYAILHGVKRREDGTMAFHDMQRAILEKLEHIKVPIEELHDAIAASPHPYRQQQHTRDDAMKDGTIEARPPSYPSPSKGSPRHKGHKDTRSKLPESVAPATMYQKNKGLRNAEVTLKMTRMCSTHIHKICSLSTANDPGVTGNIMLMRGI